MVWGLTNTFIYAAAAGFIAVLSSAWDIRTRRIPNWLTLTAAIFGLALHCYLDGWSGFLNTASAGLIAGSIFLLLFLAGGMGAGDVKLMAALAVLSGLEATPALLVYTALAGGVMGLVMALMYGRLTETVQNIGKLAGHHRDHGITPHPTLNVNSRELLRLPYAMPMLVACMINLYIAKVR